jgi:hypothetical protein
MLPKNTVLISTVLTAFVLSMLGGVAMALKQPAATVPTPVAVSATATPVALSAQEAATLAANVLNQTDIFSVESSSVSGIDAYKVVFSSGQVAFVGLDGQILSVTQIQPVVVAQNNVVPAPVHKSSGSSSSASAPAASQPSGGEHEGGGNSD